MTAKVTPFKWKERKSQTHRTATVIAKLSKDPTLRPYIVVDFGPDGDKLPFSMGGVHILGAVGSMNYASPTCSHCGEKIHLGKWRLEVFGLRRRKAPVAFQFGERFCSHGCGEEFGKAFISFGLKMQPTTERFEKCLVKLELNSTTNPGLN